MNYMILLAIAHIYFILPYYVAAFVNLYKDPVSRRVHIVFWIGMYKDNKLMYILMGGKLWKLSVRMTILWERTCISKNICDSTYLCM